MQDNIKPEFLFHYTTIETLALILKSKKIRFSSLRKVDDKLEGLTGDLKDISSSFLISCWTASEREIIPFWKLYAKSSTACRIKMQTDMFKNKYNMGVFSVDDPNYQEKEIMLDEKNNSKIIVPFRNLFKIKYFEEDKYDKHCRKNFINITKKGYFLNLLNIGTVKIDHWSFQKEYRYMLYIYPKVLKDDNNSNKIENLCNFLKTQDEYDFFDLELNDEAFKNMEIMLGPECKEEHKIIVESLIEYSKLRSKKVSISKFN